MINLHKYKIAASFISSFLDFFLLNNYNASDMVDLGGKQYVVPSFDNKVGPR